MTIDNRIAAFVKLGKFLNQFKKQQQDELLKDLNNAFYNDFEQLIKTVHIKNPWFTEQNVKNSIDAIASLLNEDGLIEFIAIYINDLKVERASKTIAVIMAGNIPMVAFHDWFCVLLSGNKILGKLSSDDSLLLPFLSKILIAIAPQFNQQIEFTEGQLKTMDAVIATGSNNSARYFDYYFGKHPHIIRKNRNSVAVLDGTETFADLKQLGNDIFHYFGLGCRNVSKLFVPRNYKFDMFYESIIDFQEIIQHNKYANNYEYNRTVYLMSNNPTLLDNNFLLLKEDVSYSSPIGVLFYEYYDDIKTLNKKLDLESDQIQCIVSKNKKIIHAIYLGMAQSPILNDYSDGVDTMKFLIDLK